jgi:hypothetical protein
MISDLVAPVAARRDFIVAVARQLGIKVTITSGYRSIEKQRQLRAQYEACLARGAVISPSNPDAACRYPANRPGDSSHNFGLSWDSSVPDEWWPAWTALRRWAGFVVPDNDRVHAEIPNWRAIAQQMYQLGFVSAPPIGGAVASPAPVAAPPAAAPLAASPPPITYPYTYQGARFRCVDGVPRFAPNTPIGPYLAGARCP